MAGLREADSVRSNLEALNGRGCTEDDSVGIPAGDFPVGIESFPGMSTSRLQFLVVVFTALLALAGCAKDQGTPTSGSGSPIASTAGGTKKKLKIGVSIPAADHGWTAGVKWWAEQASKLYPDVEWNIQTAEGPDKQIKDLETMMTAGEDAIVVLATESAPPRYILFKMLVMHVFVIG